MDCISIDGAGSAADESAQCCLDLWNAAIELYYDDAIYGDTGARIDLMGDADCLRYMCSFTGHDADDLRDKMRRQVELTIELIDLAIRGGLLVRQSYHKGCKAVIVEQMERIKAKSSELMGCIRNEEHAKSMARRFAPLNKRIGELEGMQ